MVSSRGARRPPSSDRADRADHARRLPVAVAFLGAALLAAPVRAQTSPNLLVRLSSQAPAVAIGPVVRETPAIAPGSVIGEVRVVARDIFDADDPGEDRRLFRLANRLHRTTRAGVIERQLLFRPRDAFSP